LLCKGSDGQELVVGTLEVEAPREKIRHPLRELPKVQLRREDRYLQLIKMCDGLPPLTTAVVHPCSDDALKGAIEAAERNLIAPILARKRKFGRSRRTRVSISPPTASCRPSTATMPLRWRCRWCVAATPRR
jgi:hypothetical protein